MLSTMLQICHKIPPFVQECDTILIINSAQSFPSLKADLLKQILAIIMYLFLFLRYENKQNPLHFNVFTNCSFMIN